MSGDTTAAFGVAGEVAAADVAVVDASNAPHSSPHD